MVPISSRLIESMMNLGLTKKESEAYNALVSNGVMTAEDISRTIGVQYPIVYRTLQSLKEKGWIDSTADRPKKYRAKHPKTAANIAGKQIIESVNESIEIIDRLLTPHYNENQEILTQEIWILRGYERVIQKISDMGKKECQSVNAKITGPIDDDTFNEIFTCIRKGIPIKVKIMGPPIINVHPALESYISIERPLFEGKCRHSSFGPHEASEKEEFLENVHSSRFISIHLLFGKKEAIWINIPYKDNKVVKDKVWANWILDPEYISIIMEDI
ncbi:TrmB family transcriptional regulator [Methanosalsum zhilinae]|nr:helix-turn-helix domain-containing protein [Methanosalsum zhilinae]